MQRPRGQVSSDKQVTGQAGGRAKRASHDVLRTHWVRIYPESHREPMKDHDRIFNFKDYCSKIRFKHLGETSLCRDSGPHPSPPSNLPLVHHSDVPRSQVQDETERFNNRSGARKRGLGNGRLLRLLIWFLNRQSREFI